MPLKFKPYLLKKSNYKGGKSIDEVSKNGQKIYKLSSNENPMGASPKAVEAIKAKLNSIFEYPDRTGDKLSIALSEFYGKQLLPEQFITTNSGVANLELIMRGFLDEQSEYIITNPTFGAYTEFAGKLGAKAVDIPLLGKDFQLDVLAILRAITSDTRLIIIANPNNPTGTYIPKNDIEALIQGLPDHVVLVYDEVYYQFVDVDDYTIALPYVLEGKNVIGLNSFSKAYGLAALRIGYAYSTPEIATYLRQLRRPFMINTLSLEAAIAALNDIDFITESRDFIIREKQFLYKELDKLPIEYWKTQANFILIKTKQSSDEFEALMLNFGIMVRPAHGFESNHYTRISIGSREANKAFVKALHAII